MNLKYSDNLVEDYKKLSTGRKLYIEKRAANMNVFVEWYLTEKYNIKPKEVEIVFGNHLDS